MTVLYTSTIDFSAYGEKKSSENEPCCEGLGNFKHQQFFNSQRLRHAYHDQTEIFANTLHK